MLVECTVAQSFARMGGKIRVRCAGGQGNFARSFARLFALIVVEAHPAMASPAAPGASPSPDVLMEELAAAVRAGSGAFDKDSTASKAWGVAMLNPAFETMVMDVLKKKPTRTTVAGLSDAVLDFLKTHHKGTYP